MFFFKAFILQLLCSVFVQCCMSSFSNWGLQFTPQLEGSGWPCSSCGFSSLSAASRGRSDPQTSAASCFSTWPMHMCCSRSPRFAPLDCSQHQTPSEKKTKTKLSYNHLTCEVQAKHNHLLMGIHCGCTWYLAECHY